MKRKVIVIDQQTAHNLERHGHASVKFVSKPLPSGHSRVTLKVIDPDTSFDGETYSVRLSFTLGRSTAVDGYKSYKSFAQLV